MTIMPIQMAHTQLAHSSYCQQTAVRQQTARSKAVETRKKYTDGTDGTGGEDICKRRLWHISGYLVGAVPA